jgi:LPXTG-motif cell wall-anchored protein
MTLPPTIPTPENNIVTAPQTEKPVIPNLPDSRQAGQASPIPLGYSANSKTQNSPSAETARAAEATILPAMGEETLITPFIGGAILAGATTLALRRKKKSGKYF